MFVQYIYLTSLIFNVCTDTIIIPPPLLHFILLEQLNFQNVQLSIRTLLECIFSSFLPSIVLYRCFFGDLLARKRLCYASESEFL